MYTIMMLNDKSLIATSRTTLYQREKLADKIQFLFPQTYGYLNLSEFTAVLKYVDQGNEAHAEILIPDKALYKDMIRFVLPVDTNLNRFAGDITIRITLTKVDIDNRKNYVIHTGETIIPISHLSDYFKSISDKSLEIIDQKIIELDTRIKVQEQLHDSLDLTKADDLTYKDNKLSLVSNGKKIGNEVELIIEQSDVIEFGDTLDVNEDTSDFDVVYF